MKTYSVTVMHGENRSLFFVIEHGKSESDWGIVASFRSREAADAAVERLAAEGKE